MRLPGPAKFTTPLSSSYRSEVDKKRNGDSLRSSMHCELLSREKVGLGPIRMGVGKNVTHIHWLPGPDIEGLHAGPPAEPVSCEKSVGMR